MKRYFIFLLLSIGALSGCHKEHPFPVPGIDPRVTLFDVTAQADKHSFPVTLDSKWWFKSIEADSDLGPYGNAQRVAYPKEDTIKMTWVTVVRKNDTQIEVLVDSNTTDSPKLVMMHLQSYQGEQLIQIHQDRARR